jgi:DNA-binding response OmpR family regulator
MKRVLLIDDDHEVLQINREYLEKEGYQVDTAPSVPQALAQIRKKQPDCIVMDVMMPGIDGFEGLSSIREYTDAPILYLTGKTGEEDRIQGLSLGADDYISKPYSLKELSLRIMIHIGKHKKTNREKSTLDFPPLRIELLSHKAFYNEEEIPLSNREFNLLTYLAMHPEQILTFEEIGTELLGTYLDSDRKTVMVSTSRLRKKLEGYVGLEQMIQTVWGKGYCFKG